jgi:cell division protein FtsI/penicillin-binding protein 2
VLAVNRRGRNHGVRATIAGAVLALAATSCGSVPDAAPTADALAAALMSGDFNAVPLAGATAREATLAVAEITERMGESGWAVDVGGIEHVEDDAADHEVRAVTLDVTWDLAHADEPWSYTTTARLDLVEDVWQVTWTPALVHPDLDEGDRLVLRREQAERGDVLGADGEALVTERPVYRVGIDKTLIEAGDQAAAAADLAAVIGVDPDGFASRVEGAGDRAFVEAITLREEDADELLDAVDDIDGARAISGTLPLAPTRTFARPILGAVGESTAEIVEESAGRVQPGDLTGLSGLQRAYDETLSGVPGVRVEIVPDDGDPTTVFERPAEPGTAVTLTLDIDLQMAAEQVLVGVESPSAIVAIRPSDGHVLAAASGAGADGYSVSMLGQYPPGSTFKVVSALALTRAGHTLDTTVQCPPTVTVDGRQFGNYSDYPSTALGDIDLRTAFAQSCNTAFIGERAATSQAELAEAAASLGLGLDHDLGLPAFLGSVPTEAEGTEHAASMIGQGRVLASPIAMAAVAASVADGRTGVPTIMPGAAAPPNTLTAAEAATLADLMRATVESGTAAFLQDVPGEPVGAKTGTAEYGTETPPDTHGWIIAIQGDLAVAVFVEEAESGSATAGPLLAEFLHATADR